MKTTLLNALLLGLVAFSACNGRSSDKTRSTQGQSTPATNETIENLSGGDKDLKVVNPKFTDVDAKVISSIKEVVEHYGHLNDALANDDARGAGAAAKALNEAFAKIDQATLDEEQKAILHDYGDDLKEMAEHITTKPGDIGHQREHFALLSEDVYAIVKAFGAGKTLYHFHCPLYNKNRGALWLSESKEIRNPYFPNKMKDCSELKEVIK
jgi:hypothetical protein